MTLTQIATHLDVSISTVSRVLNNDETLQINPKTRIKIINYANKVGYINKISQNKPNLMVYYCHDEMFDEIDPFFKEIKNFVLDYADEHKYNTYFYIRNEIPDTTANINGIIAIGTYNSKEIEFLSTYSENIIFVNSFTSLDNYDSIVSDIQQSMEDAIHFFIDRDITKIGFIGGNKFTHEENTLRFNHRQHFFKYYMNINNLDDTNIYIGSYTKNSGYTLIKEIIKTGNLSQAYICANDSIAEGVLKGLIEHNIKVPEDVQLLGFNNDDFSKDLLIPLSTISVPKKDMAEIAINTLVQRIQKPRSINQRIVLPTNIIERNTTK